MGKTRLTVTTNRGVQYNMVLIVRQNPKTPMDVKLDKPASTSVDVKMPLRLSYSLVPATAEGTVRWTTSDAEVATVEDGLVTPHKLGTATIGVVTDFGGYSDSVKLTFVDGSIPTDIDITKPASTRLDVSRTLQLAYTVKPAGTDAHGSRIHA